MSDIGPGPNELPQAADVEATQSGSIGITEKSSGLEPTSPAAPTTPIEARLSSQVRERPGALEHLAARRPVPELDPDKPEIKERLNTLRIEVTRLLTDLRWKGATVRDTAEQIIPLLNIGSVQQWKNILIPYLFEVDRAGNLIPVWLQIIERGDPEDLPSDSNPAETPEGRARRFAILMLGNYKVVETAPRDTNMGFPPRRTEPSQTKVAELPKILEKLALDPNSSLYATQSLSKQGTAAALEALVHALQKAEGWAKVDVVEACLSLNLAHLHDLLIANGLEHVGGLESYIAIPIYQAISLEKYLRDKNGNPQMSKQAALIFAQVLQESMRPPLNEESSLPVAFEQNLPALATALFEGARTNPTWQNILAVHKFALLQGRYWTSISKGELKDRRIQETVYRCLVMMNEIERWMAGPGRDVLLETLKGRDSAAQIPVLKILSDLREPRAISFLLTTLEEATKLADRQQALLLSSICDALAHLGDRRATAVMLQLVQRVIDRERRSSLPKQSDNLPNGDPDIPGSIVYGAVIRACGILVDTTALETVQQAANDFDPYVRTQALEALKRLDSTGESMHSHQIVRAALDDPRNAVVQLACQLISQYRDLDAVPALRNLIATRPLLAANAYDALRQLGQ
ncbi:HEAT repeat domain-containing protein [Ktedonosporobacter rubrisoli]|uniref:HEAT repeat domain-containing protein n=1 Tax=Ktedonosporobacter rubrisoli TaxID=2509675 RepID=A0A4P6K1C2_KTERU|nr:HEAT repeat domain-containing protein [Ktedonosporobacter rubrisoli]QBD81785.1 HEAT repeat domain-containing protein [Ktedonosporobacter rubrisoli]